MLSWLRSACLLLALALSLPALLAHAQVAGAAESYDRLVEQGLAAFHADRKWEARGYFERAHALLPSARTWRVLGLADFALERFSLAKQELSAALTDARNPLTAEQSREASDYLAWIRSSHASLQLECSPADAAVQVDGQPQTLSEVVLTPGEHQVRVVAAGYEPRERTVRLEVAQTFVLTIALTPVRASGETAPPLKAAASEPAAHGTSWPLWLGGAGVAAVVGGATLFALGVADYNNVEHASQGSQFSQLEASHDRAPWFTGVGLGVGLAGLASIATAALILTAEPRRSEPAVSLRARPSAFELRGSF